jgi:UDP-N-acetylglucosamine--N-acetylmuramyl-(pentapeptide) pyrophosphoryl-undecaprenol N-acetylglucosamine transferase
MEQNVLPGLANRVLGRVATAVAVAEERTASFFPGRAVVTGNPVRPGFKTLARRDHQRPFSVLVTGGSQGAEAINRAVIDALAHLDPAVVGFVHQAGKRQVETIRAAYEKAGFTALVASFFDSFEELFGEADLIVCRAGAKTVAEARAAGRATIMIPLQFAADDHQRKNARAMVDQGAAVMIDPDELSGELLAREIMRLLDDPRLLSSIEENARRMAILDAESRIMDLVEEAVEGRKRGRRPDAK